MNLTTPALLFPAISLLLLAYTNRFLVVAQLIRTLIRQNQDDPNSDLTDQILNLKIRIEAIRRMQVLGVLAFIGCVLAMFFLFLNQATIGTGFFALSLLLLVASLCFSLYEVQISGRALNLQLKGLEFK
ncbi:DUF2721 domain-containing protein [Saccharospirillum mangrovi]|uniref:DUF2721 domain-containing protein n=1 Tax=Saccharospirillum mangrovi TaxID=2161747 RepID=UPI000D3744BC|nr:DUF2721 domain-containing protein [Saccharospirillum mangrovi]